MYIWYVTCFLKRWVLLRHNSQPFFSFLLTTLHFPLFSSLVFIHTLNSSDRRTGCLLLSINQVCNQKGDRPTYLHVVLIIYALHLHTSSSHLHGHTISLHQKNFCCCITTLAISLSVIYNKHFSIPTISLRPSGSFSFCPNFFHIIMLLLLIMISFFSFAFLRSLTFVSHCKYIQTCWWLILVLCVCFYVWQFFSRQFA